MSVFQFRNLSDTLLVNIEKFYFLDIFLEAYFKNRNEDQCIYAIERLALQRFGRK